MIRRCRPSEIPEITRLNNLGAKEVKDWTLYSVKEMRNFSRFRDLLLVAEVRGEIAGFVSGYYYTFTPAMKVKWGEKCAGIENIFVRKEFRGRGIGKALVKDFCRRWKSRGCKYIEVAVSEEGKLEYYRKLGFRELLYLPYQKL